MMVAAVLFIEYQGAGMLNTDLLSDLNRFQVIENTYTNQLSEDKSEIKRMLENNFKIQFMGF